MEEKTHHKPTLASYIEDNHKLITVLGVFTALTVFSTNLRLQPFGYLLSWLFMSLALLVWIELWGRFPNKKGNWTLTWFENFLSIAVLVVLVYWLVDFRQIWHLYLFIPVASGFLAIFSYVMQRYDLFNRFFKSQPGKRRWLRYTLGFASVICITVFAYWISLKISPSINLFLDEAYKNMSTPISPVPATPTP